jgi:2-dehydro-3-deoxyphosphogluconate aldolase/(4S)-4-hydroxy-2-oxoglutarate aldolase
MNKQAVRERILEIGIVPVVRAASPEMALAAARAVSEGGIPIVEVTMTVPGATEVISELTKSMGRQLLIGAGTVLDAATGKRCIEAGAQFLVSPGFNAGTVEMARGEGVLMMPGALTPTEIITAWEAGVDFVKVFPCGNLGGPSYIKALKAALPQIPMIPTGGVNLTTAAQFFEAGAAALGVGGELISASALKAGNVSSITEAAREYAALAREVRATRSAMHVA